MDEETVKLKKKTKKSKRSNYQDNTMDIDYCPPPPVSSGSRTHLRIRPRSRRHDNENDWQPSSPLASEKAEYETVTGSRMSPRSEGGKVINTDQENVRLGNGPMAMRKMTSMSPDVLRILAEEAWCDGSIANERRINSWASNHSESAGNNNKHGSGPDEVRLVGCAPVLPLVPSLPGGGRIGNKTSSGTVSPNPYDVYRTGSIASLECARSFASSRKCSSGSSQLGSLASFRSGNLFAPGHSQDIDKNRHVTPNFSNNVTPTRQTSNIPSPRTGKLTSDRPSFDATRFDSEDN